MQYGKAIAAQVILREEYDCHDQFEKLVSQLATLPDNMRGERALNLSAKLLELAAFELAGAVDSKRIGVLIEIAAELAKQSADVAAEQVATMTGRAGCTSKSASFRKGVDVTGVNGTRI